MARKPFDPLAVIPSPEIVRQRLAETLTLAERLRILLDLAERLAQAEGLPQFGAAAHKLSKPDAAKAKGGRDA